MISKYIISKLLDAALDKTKKYLARTKSSLRVSKTDIEEAIANHLREVNNWSSEVSFSELKRAKHVLSIFIELKIFVMPRKRRIAGETVDELPLGKIFSATQNHVILLGQPGAGKTTSMKHICQSLFQDDAAYDDRFAFPLLIRLRDLNDIERESSSQLIIDQIFNVLGLDVDFPEALKKIEGRSSRKAIKEQVVMNVLEELGLLLILDGFDELASQSLRLAAINDIKKLALNLERSGMIVTSRTGDFVYNIENTTQYEICPLNSEQIWDFAQKWLEDNAKAIDFLAKVDRSPFADTAIRPLTLAHLCAIYERLGTIPEKPKTVYRRVVNLLLEEWDQQRSVKRSSKYANFELDRKYEFLSTLAYTLTTVLSKAVFSRQEFRQAYREIYDQYALEESEVQTVVAELESHTGLFLETGHDQFEFAHKSLQEFLTAEYIVKLPTLPQDYRQLLRLPNELAIATSISSKPSEYLFELIVRRLAKREVGAFASSFISRLLLERPDFSNTPRLLLSLLTLYSLFAQSAEVAKGDWDRPDIIQFEEMLIALFESLPADQLFDAYRMKSSSSYWSDDELIVMERIQAIPPGPYSFAELPEKLHIRRSLLKNERYLPILRTFFRSGEQR